jgi:hypothetical protein
MRVIVRAIDGGVASELEYVDDNGKTVGYWAYGSWDDNLPYRGEGRS